MSCSSVVSLSIAWLFVMLFHVYLQTVLRAGWTNADGRGKLVGEPLLCHVASKILPACLSLHRITVDCQFCVHIQLGRKELSIFGVQYISPDARVAAGDGGVVGRV